MTGEELAMLTIFATLAVLLVAALVVSGLRRRRAPAVPTTRFVPHWQLMLMAGAAVILLCWKVVAALIRTVH